MYSSCLNKTFHYLVCQLDDLQDHIVLSVLALHGDAVLYVVHLVLTVLSCQNFHLGKGQGQG